MKDTKVSVLDDNWTFFKKWLQNLIGKRGSDSVLSLGQIDKMVVFIEEFEKDIDEVILESLGSEPDSP